MMIGKAINCKKIIITKAKNRKKNLNQFSFKLKFLNFKAKRGISAFSIKQLKIVITTKNHLLRMISTIHASG